MLFFFVNLPSIFNRQNLSKMKLSQNYIIPFVGLKLGKHVFDYTIDKTFLDLFNYDEFDKLNTEVTLTLDKMSTLMELTFKHKGAVEVPCDRSNIVFDLPIKGKIKIVVKFGEVFNNNHEEILIIPHGTSELDVSQFIYELIILSIPAKRVHPDYKKADIVIENDKTMHEKETDPRWDNLKNLIINNK